MLVGGMPAAVLTNKEYGISEALVLNNKNMQQKGNVLYAPIYMTMFVEKKRVIGETRYVLDSLIC